MYHVTRYTLNAYFQAPIAFKTQQAQHEEANEVIQSAVQGIFSFYQQGNKQLIRAEKIYIQPHSHQLLATITSLYSATLYAGFGINKSQYQPNPKRNMQLQLCDIAYFTKHEDQIFYEKRAWQWLCTPYYSEKNVIQRQNQQFSLLDKFKQILSRQFEEWNYESYQLYPSKDNVTTFKFSKDDKDQLHAVILFYSDSHQDSSEDISESIMDEIASNRSSESEDFRSIQSDNEID